MDWLDTLMRGRSGQASAKGGALDPRGAPNPCANAAEQRYLAQIADLEARLRSVRRDVGSTRADLATATARRGMLEEFFLRSMGELRREVVRKEALGSARSGASRSHS